MESVDRASNAAITFPSKPVSVKIISDVWPRFKHLKDESHFAVPQAEKDEARRNPPT